MAKKLTVTESIDIDVYLEDFDDDDIREEYAKRFGDPAEIHADDTDRLARLIVEGATDEALDLLRRIAPDTIHPSTVKRLVADRQNQRSFV